MTNNTKKQQLIQQGAEAKIFKKAELIIKNRISKGYRHPTLDKKIIRRRTRSEAKILTKVAKLIPCPTPSEVTNDKIKMPFINGKKLSESLENLNYKKISKIIAQQIAKIHDNDIIHGDLTTSNMIWTNDKNNLHFIDFGLGFISTKIEDKAVDLHLIQQALEAKHFSIWQECWQIITTNYNSKNKTQTLDQLKKVESRGRYKGH
jgi:Kae1-associated kinase Bud32